MSALPRFAMFGQRRVLRQQADCPSSELNYRHAHRRSRVMLQIVRVVESVGAHRQRRVWPPPHLKEPEEAKRLAPRQWRRAPSWWVQSPMDRVLGT